METLICDILYLSRSQLYKLTHKFFANTLWCYKTYLWKLRRVISLDSATRAFCIPRILIMHAGCGTWGSASWTRKFIAIAAMECAGCGIEWNCPSWLPYIPQSWMHSLLFNHCGYRWNYNWNSANLHARLVAASQSVSSTPALWKFIDFH